MAEKKPGSDRKQDGQKNPGKQPESNMGKGREGAKPGEKKPGKDKK